ncbi:MAG: GNAT family N-acetyltransferase [Woeseiaceae bacterium]|nr:GNAT family N-acetyltransferase [Woeseiaceae bacterium]
MPAEILASITEIAAQEWNALAGDRWPFLRHEFLAAAETSGSVSVATGWQPCHIVLRDESGVLRAAMPLYEKTHSWGEFVFDWAWAQAYHRVGIDYYPKLVSAVPFTPAPCRKLLLADPGDAESARQLIEAALQLAADRHCSSLHLQFVDPPETGTLAASGMLLRKDCQFHWHNRGYRDFDEFLASFSSAKRRKARQDRRYVAEQGISFRWLDGGQIDAETWASVYELIGSTFQRHGSMPYFNLPFFTELSRQLPEQTLLVIAERERKMIAAAVFYVSATTLYGRYWGADAEYNALHFETCYYQGIDYCIGHGIQRFEPGTQGEHKISRGFLPVTTWSAHWLANRRFADAISRYLDSEQRHVEQYMALVENHSPYRDASGTDLNTGARVQPDRGKMHKSGGT